MAPRQRSIRHPLLPAALLLISGVLLSRVLPEAPAVWTGVAAGALAGFVAWRALARGLSWNAAAQGFLALAMVFSGVAFAQVEMGFVGPGNIVLAAPPHGKVLCTARLVIASEPIISHPLHAGPLFGFAPSATTFVGVLRQVRGPRGWRKASGRVTVRVNASVPYIHHNQLVQVDGWLSRPRAPLNPGAFNHAAYLRGQRIFATIFVQHGGQVRLLSRRQRLWPISGWLSAYQANMRRRLAQTMPESGGAPSAVAALTLGYRTPAMRRVARAFARCGAAHLLAISGLHVVFVAAAAWWILRLFIYRPRRRAWAVMLVVALYILATPCGPAVLRAGIASLLVLTIILAGLPVSGVQVLAVAAIAVVLVRPADVFTAPFALTFAVTAAMLLLGRRVHDALFARYLRRHSAIARAIGTRPAAAWAYLQRSFCSIATFNGIAALAAFPLVAYHYNQMNFLSFILPVLLLPLLLLVLLLAAGQLALAWASVTAGRFVAGATVLVARLMDALAAVLARVPGASITVRHPPGWWVALAYGVLLIWVARRALYFSRATVAVLFAGAVALLAGSYAATQQHAAARLWAPAMGTGNAALVRGPDGATLLINAGTVGSASAAEHRIADMLRYEGIGHLDACVVTRISADHAAAILALAHRYGCNTVWCGPADAHARTLTWSLKRFYATAKRMHIALRSLAAGQVLHIGRALRCRALWPPENVAGALPVRQAGLGLKLSCHGRAVLLLDKTLPLRRAEALAARQSGPSKITSIAARAVFFGRGRMAADTVATLRALGVRQVALTGRSSRIRMENGAALRQAGFHPLWPNSAGAVQWRFGAAASVHVSK